MHAIMQNENNICHAIININKCFRKQITNITIVVNKYKYIYIMYFDWFAYFIEVEKHKCICMIYFEWFACFIDVQKHKYICMITFYWFACFVLVFAWFVMFSMYELFLHDLLLHRSQIYKLKVKDTYKSNSLFQMCWFEIKSIFVRI